MHDGSAVIKGSLKLECATLKIADFLIQHQGKPEALPQFGNSSSEFLCSDFLVIFYF
jgi:hypothetical protein